MPAWVPVLFGVVTPMIFALNDILSKHLINDRGMDSFKITYGNMTIVSFLLTMYALVYFQTNPFDRSLLSAGFLGAIFNTSGIAFIIYAISIGPAGPVSALASSNTIPLTIIEAFRFSAIPNYLEVTGLILGFVGSLVLTIPN